MLIIFTSAISQAFEEVITGLLIFTAVVFGVGVVIAVWRMIKFFNSGNRYLKESKARKEAIEKLKKNKQNKENINKAKNNKK